LQLKKSTKKTLRAEHFFPLLHPRQQPPAPSLFFISGRQPWSHPPVFDFFFSSPSTCPIASSSPQNTVPPSPSHQHKASGRSSLTNRTISPRHSTSSSAVPHRRFTGLTDNSSEPNRRCYHQEKRSSTTPPPPQNLPTTSH